jgi:putative restriction endonuclease
VPQRHRRPDQRDVKAVLTHKPHSIYDDLPEERYNFPRTYLRQVEAAVGDFVVYYEPGRTGVGDHARTGRRAYVATARVASIIEDRNRRDHYYALIEQGSYVQFGRPVPFRDGAHYYEAALRRDDGGTSKGAFGRAVRPISDAEYEAIVAAGFAAELADLPSAVAHNPRSLLHPGLMETPDTFERSVVERVLSRPVRDAAFARAVQAAYDATCAMTGLKIINGGGHAEVQAAHIRPVQDRGPDSIRNGIALSATVHWMFDRGLVSIGPPPDFAILTSHHRLPEAARRLLNASGRLRLPHDARFWPAPTYLDYHRERVFKG